MFNLLLDSSNQNLSVGLSQKGKLIDEISYDAWQTQSELMISEVDKILKKHNATRQDLAAVVVSKGPGSYTGVRIALTIAKTISFALNIPLYLVSSLEALKDSDKPTICLMNARSKRSYVGVYQGSKCLVADTIWENEEVNKYCKSHADYTISGVTDYLGLVSKPVEILANLAKLDDETHLCKEPLAARPVYLKDNYPV
jgi:tRNA threonylcarbamoyladenosine biosynthesis protein TsaB